MASFEVVLILLLAVILSGLCAKILPFAAPLPLVQIAFGAAIAAFADLGVQLDPQVFFVLVLPPLLFYDGWRVPKEGLLRDKGTILALAIGLVAFTVGGVGLFVHWLIPAMPLAVAFAFAAVISPTDAVAVSAMSSRIQVPKRLMRILEGEALFNDASGIVCMRFAVAAALTGTFSPVDAAETFAWLAVGGLAIGFGVTWAVSMAKDAMWRRFGEDTGSQILITLLIPFGAYLLAEALGCSGILAAVAAGVTMSYEEQSGSALAITRVRRTGVWETLYFGATGVIFILLGEQLPEIATGAAKVVRETGHTDPAWLAVYILAIIGALAALRFAWAWATLQFTLFRAAHQGQAAVAPSWRLIAATALAGVRGTVTLAGVLTLPLTLGDGSPFPARDVAIFLAAGVIIGSLLAACILLPFLFRDLKLPPDTSEQQAEDEARVAASKAGMEAVAAAEREFTDGRSDATLASDAAASIMVAYRHRIETRSRPGVAADEREREDYIERKLRLAGTRAERNEIYRLVHSRRLSDETARELVREIDLLETRIGGGPAGRPAR